MKKSKSPKRRSLIPPGYTPAEPTIVRFNEAENYFAAQNFSLARDLLTSIIAQDKHFTPALRQLGLCELRLGSFHSAIKYLTKYCKYEPQDALAHASLAQAHMASGEFIRARQQIATALRADTTADLLFLAAELEEKIGDFDKAVKFYRKGLKLAPDRSGAKLALAQAYKNGADFAAADQILAEILALAPDNPFALTNRGTLYHAIGAFETAAETFQHALTQEKHPDIYYNLGLSYQQLHLTEKSLECFEQALELLPSHLDARIQYAESLSQLGRFDAAREIYERIFSEHPAHCRAAYLMTQIVKYQEPNDVDEQRLIRLKKTSSDRNDQVLISFALAKLYDDTGRYGLAFNHAEQANKQKSKLLGHSPHEYIDTLDRTIEIDELAQTKAGVANGAGPIPIFIVGMPRSGTTLLEKFICRSPEVASCGEVDYFGPALFRHEKGLAEFVRREKQPKLDSDALAIIKNAYLARVTSQIGECRYFVDKTPDNFKYFALLSALFPQAYFIHCKRNPLDTGLSIFFQLFEGLAYAYQLSSIGECYLKTETVIGRLKAQAAQSWFTQSYEDLVQEPLSTAANLSDFLNIELSASVTEQEDRSTAINTMSKWQARQAVYENSIGRWRNYQEQLAPLQTILADVL